MRRGLKEKDFTFNKCLNAANRSLKGAARDQCGPEAVSQLCNEMERDLGRVRLVLCEVWRL